MPAHLSAGVVSPAQMRRSQSTVAAIVLTLLFLGIIVYYRRDKRLYAGFAITMILNMVVLPALHTQQIYAANLSGQERAGQYQRRSRRPSAIVNNTRRNRPSTIFDPHKDPLANLDPALVARWPGFAADSHARIRTKNSMTPCP